MLSDASVERQCQLCAQDISKTYDEERLEEFVKESHQTPSPDDWIGKIAEDEARMPVYLQTVNLLRADPWLGIHGGSVRWKTLRGGSRSKEIFGFPCI